MVKTNHGSMRWCLLGLLVGLALLSLAFLLRATRLQRYQHLDQQVFYFVRAGKLAQARRLVERALATYEGKNSVPAPVLAAAGFLLASASDRSERQLLQAARYLEAALHQGFSLADQPPLREAYAEILFALGRHSDVIETLSPLPVEQLRPREVLLLAKSYASPPFELTTVALDLIRQGILFADGDPEVVRELWTFRTELLHATGQMDPWRSLEIPWASSSAAWVPQALQVEQALAQGDEAQALRRLEELLAAQNVPEAICRRAHYLRVELWTARADTTQALAALEPLVRRWPATFEAVAGALLVGALLADVQPNDSSRAESLFLSACHYARELPTAGPLSQEALRAELLSVYERLLRQALVDRRWDRLRELHGGAQRVVGNAESARLLGRLGEQLGNPRVTGFAGSPTPFEAESEREGSSLQGGAERLWVEAAQLLLDAASSCEDKSEAARLRKEAIGLLGRARAWEEAATWAKQLWEESGDPALGVDAVRLLRLSGRAEEARELARALLSRELPVPLMLAARLELSYLHVAAGELPAARVLLEENLEQGPIAGTEVLDRLDESKLLYAAILLDSGHVQEALGYLSPPSLSPNSPHWFVAQLLRVLGYRRYLETWSAAQPSEGDKAPQKGFRTARLRAVQELTQSLQGLLQSEEAAALPRSVRWELQILLGRCYGEQGRHVEALEQLRRCKPTSQDVFLLRDWYFDMAQCLWSLDRVEEARRMLQEWQALPQPLGTPQVFLKQSATALLLRCATFCR